MESPPLAAALATSTADRRDFLLRTAGIALGFLSGGLAGCAGGAAEVHEPAFPGRGALAGPPRAARVPPRELLPVPDLSDAMVLGAVAGIRPYRRGGVRLELAALPDGRPLVHDYGHGGAGITLAWGCAEEVLDLLRPRLAPPAEVAVLGAGIAGMAAAWALGEAGYRVTIHAEAFTPATTSDVAGGQFAPSIVDVERTLERRDRFERILRRSYQRYAAQVGARHGVSRRDNYATAGHGDGLARIPRGILPPPEDVDLPFPGPPRRGQRFRTLLIEPPVYLPRLLADLEAHGVRRVRRRFESFGELASLPERAVIDCLGLGAGALFGDRALVPVRGQLVHLRPQALPYLLSAEGYLFPRRDALVLGGTVEWNVRQPAVDDRAVGRILARHRAFFGSGSPA